MRLLITIVCLLLPLSCFAEGLKLPPDDSSVWGSMTVRSYHLNRESDHHESNFGVGLEYHFNPTWRAVAGEYKNSFWHHTNYGGVMWMPLDLSHGFRFGLMTAFANGYDSDDLQKYQWMTVPMFTYEHDRIGANLVTLIGGLHRGALALQLKYKF